MNLSNIYLSPLTLRTLRNFIRADRFLRNRMTRISHKLLIIRQNKLRKLSRRNNNRRAHISITQRQSQTNLSKNKLDRISFIIQFHTSNSMIRVNFFFNSLIHQQHISNNTIFIKQNHILNHDSPYLTPYLLDHQFFKAFPVRIQSSQKEMKGVS